jgi:hypothetical protein
VIVCFVGRGKFIHTLKIASKFSIIMFMEPLICPVSLSISARFSSCMRINGGPNTMAKLLAPICGGGERDREVEKKKRKKEKKEEFV